MKLIRIPEEKYDDYRLDVIFRAYKWDPQFADNNTISKYALVITAEEHSVLSDLTERLHKETIEAELVLNRNQKAIKPLALPRKLRKELPGLVAYQPEMHIRLMRFDFHPVRESGWAVSEVNSDVPGGFAESSILPGLAAGLFDGADYSHICFGDMLADEIAKKAGPGGSVMLVHCTSYSDDRQVMQYMGDKLESLGLRVVYAAADHLCFEEKKAVSILGGNEGEVDVVFRYAPLEWLVNMKPKHWKGYFDSTTPACNYPVSVFAQTKRFPLLWEKTEEMGVALHTWRELLPETLDVRDARGKQGYLYKPAFGRVGEGITIKEACRDDELKKTMRDMRRRPKTYVAQKRFDSLPIVSDDGESYHVCIGSFGLEGRAAGYYGRISKTPRIDSGAEDIPVLIEGMGSAKNAIYTVSEISAEKSMNYGNAADVVCHGPARSFTALAARAEEESKRKEVFKPWAPPGAKWTPWVRPAPFAGMTDFSPEKTVANFAIQGGYYLDGFDASTAIFLDLPGHTGVCEGLALAGRGWRAVPLYNYTKAQKGSMALVEYHDIECALIWGAGILKSMEIPNDAPPAFLLDSNRRNMHKMNAGVFDNSWDIFRQDVPSADFLLENGISKVVVRAHAVQKDLSGILFGYQKKGIKILFTDGYCKPRLITISKPNRRFRP